MSVISIWMWSCVGWSSTKRSTAASLRATGALATFQQVRSHARRHQVPQPSVEYWRSMW